MRLVGFNGRQIREGTSGRGHKSPLPEPGEDSEEKSDTSKPFEIRGPYCPDSIASHVQAIAANALERLFNGVVSAMAARSFFPKKTYKRNNPGSDTLVILTNVAVNKPVKVYDG
jgi:hypothetical protein